MKTRMISVGVFVQRTVLQGLSAPYSERTRENGIIDDGSRTQRLRPIAKNWERAKTRLDPCPIGTCLLALTAAALLLAPFPGGADIGPLQVFKGSGVVAPRSPHQSIRLDSQEVVIRVHRTIYLVDAVFNFSIFSTPGDHD